MTVYLAGCRFFVPPRIEALVDATSASRELIDDPYSVAKAKLEALREERPDDVFLGRSLLPLLIQASVAQRGFSPNALRSVKHLKSSNVCQ